MKWSLLLSCEHGGNRIPRELKSFFPAASKAVLATHRGWDIGALAVARSLAERFHAPLYFTEWSRLVIDTNRSWGHASLFSEYTRHLSSQQREHIRLSYYAPYREPVADAVAALLEKGQRVFHLSVHSFTPVLKGDVRRAGIGLLYDPRRALEKRIAAQWLAALESQDAFLPVRRNYPYRGVSDGFVASLRKNLPASRYVGFEIEMNQKHLLRSSERARMADVVATSLHEILR